jgi:hypothetical protein
MMAKDSAPFHEAIGARTLPVAIAGRSILTRKAIVGSFEVGASLNGMSERSDFPLHCRPGTKCCVLGADWNPVRDERTQIRHSDPR